MKRAAIGQPMAASSLHRPASRHGEELVPDRGVRFGMGPVRSAHQDSKMDVIGSPEVAGAWMPVSLGGLSLSHSTA